MNNELMPIPESTAIERAKPAVAYLATMRSETGRRGMVSSLNKIAQLAGAETWQDLDWTRLTPEVAGVIRAKLDGAPATVNKTLAALRGVARQLFDAGHIDADDLRRIENATKAVKGSRLPAGRDVGDWEQAALMRACATDKAPAGARDAAMFAIAMKCGARREEIASIKVENIRQVEDGIEVAVIGKGDKERLLFLDGGALAALNDWLALRGDATGPLFNRIKKGGHIIAGSSLTTTSMHLVLQKRAKEAGLSDIGWHDFRRTVVGALLDQGEDLNTVAGVVGHSDVRTTARYDRRPERQKRRAVRKISTPYFGR